MILLYGNTQIGSTQYGTKPDTFPGLKVQNKKKRIVIHLSNHVLASLILACWHITKFHNKKRNKSIIWLKGKVSYFNFIASLVHQSTFQCSMASLMGLTSHLKN